jgi:Holliday junction resolvase RusA-like endonuclease
MQLQFIVPGEPQGKGRPRFGNGRTYTPAKTVAYEQLIARTAAEAMRHLPYELTDLPCYVRVDVYKGVPKSWSKAKRARALDGQEIPGKPDLDNVAKGVLDAMNGVAYIDDTQVVRLLVQKQYSLEPRLVVTVKEMLE